MSEFEPNIAAGSTYAVEIKRIREAFYTIKNAFGQTVVIHNDDIPAMIELLDKLVRTE